MHSRDQNAALSPHDGGERFCAAHDRFAQIAGAHEDWIVDLNRRRKYYQIGVAGSGSAMLAMCKFPFSRVDGIELSKEISEIAIQNLTKLKMQRWQIFNGDAIAYKDYWADSAVQSAAYTISIPPTLSSATINTAGTQLTLNWSASVTKTGSGNVTVSASGGASTPTYSSGSPGTSYVYNLSRTIDAGETVTTSYTQPGNDLEATSGGADVATYSAAAVTNNSTVNAAPTADLLRLRANEGTGSTVAATSVTIPSPISSSRRNDSAVPLARPSS